MARHFAMTDDADPVALLQRAHDRRADRHAADLLDLAARDRLPIGDERQRLQQRARIARRTLLPQARHDVGAARHEPARASRSRPRSARCRATRSRRRAGRARRAAARLSAARARRTAPAAARVLTGRPAASSVASMRCLRSCSFISLLPDPDYRLERPRSSCCLRSSTDASVLVVRRFVFVGLRRLRQRRFVLRVRFARVIAPHRPRPA